MTVFTRENIPNNKIALWLKLYQEVGKGDSKKERGGIKASGTWRELSDYLIQSADDNSLTSPTKRT